MRQDRVGALAASFYYLRVVRVGIARHVNVASMAPRATPSTRCPTQHYKGMVKLNQAYGARGLQILAFPCNQFLKQESGSAEEILAGARSRGFDGDGMHLMKKVKVNGPDADAVFLFLKQEAPCQIKWNFGAYFVVDGAGTVESFAGVHPRDLTARLDALLA